MSVVQIKTEYENGFSYNLKVNDVYPVLGDIFNVTVLLGRKRGLLTDDMIVKYMATEDGLDYFDRIEDKEKVITIGDIAENATPEDIADTMVMPHLANYHVWYDTWYGDSQLVDSPT